MYKIAKHNKCNGNNESTEKCFFDVDTVVSHQGLEDKGLSLDTAMDTLVTEGIIDMNYGGILPRLLCRIEESHRISRQSGLYFSQKAESHGNPQQKKKSIFTQEEERNYLKQSCRIENWFKVARSQTSRHAETTSEVKSPLTSVMDYINDKKQHRKVERDNYWNGIVRARDLNFSDSDKGDSVNDSCSYVDGMSTCSTGPGSGGITQEECSQQNNDSSVTLDALTGGRDGNDGIFDGLVDAMHVTDLFSKGDCCDAEGVMKQESTMNLGNSESCSPNTQMEMTGSYKINSNVAVGTPPEPQYKIEDDVCNNEIKEAGVNFKHSLSGSAGLESFNEEHGNDAHKEDDPHYYVNTTILVYGNYNLTVQCLYIISCIAKKPIKELLSNQDYQNQRYAFVEYQNTSMQHICCIKLNSAFHNNVITLDGLRDILTNKKSKCCFLENFDALRRDIQITIAKYLIKNERIVVISASFLSDVVSNVRDISFNFKAAPLDVKKMVEAASDNKFSPNVFAGLSRIAIEEYAKRARDNISAICKSLLDTSETEASHIKYYKLLVRRLVHCISFQKNSLSSRVFIEKTVTDLLPAYLEDRNMFWLDFMDNVQALGSPQLINAKPELYRLIAQRSTPLARNEDHKVVLEEIFQAMMEIVSSS
ncbi:hypothetical protein BgAZ_102600 [Babesia gibsoni]|uniref:Uncharacterized protein n=1 Tax=Babesia gibsoni TaxID=33632 RepID=A0AAD8PFF0_BABGI|nr:hypothetical protein BgAZ_102600 [Babesia gibsoni]